MGAFTTRLRDLCFLMFAGTRMHAKAYSVKKMHLERSVGRLKITYAETEKSFGKCIALSVTPHRQLVPIPIKVAAPMIRNNTEAGLEGDPNEKFRTATEYAHK